MRKLICLLLTAALVVTPATSALAKNHNYNGNQNRNQQQEQEKEQKQGKEQKQDNVRIKEQKKSFKINGASVIKYGRYKIPIAPITKGMGATVTFDKATGVLTVVKDTTTIMIDFKNKTVTVNGAADSTSGIFTAKNSKKMTVLIKYVAKVLGVRINVGKDKITVTIPGLDFPTNITVTPIGGAVVANTLNSTNVAMTATAAIKAGQAVKAELYVGDKLVATDSAIAATDTSVTFTTADDTPTAAELQALIPTGGVITVRLYNSGNQYVISKTANPTLKVDYTAPTVTSVVAATYTVSGSTITIAVTGASLPADKVDVTKLSLYDTALARSYTLTNTAGIGSTGVVMDAGTLVITLGSVDKAYLTGFGTSTLFLNIAPGSLLYDDAGNVSLPGAAQMVAVNVIR